MHDISNNIIGCVCYVVFSMAPRDSWRYDADMILKFADIHSAVTQKNYTIIPVILDESLITVKSNHIRLTYFPLESSWDVLNKIARIDIHWGKGLGIQVKNCGYRWVHKEDLQEFNLTMMNHRNSLAQKRKFFCS